MLVPIFTLKLNQKIHPRTVAVGKFDGKHPCITAATTANKVLIHNPHLRLSNGGRLEQGTGDLNLLNINQQVSAVTCGTFDGSSRDILFVGTQTNLLAYDVENNSDLFYKDAPDGVNALLIGAHGSSSNPMILAGGNCAVQGFDHEGNDQFWTVTGDNVASLAFCNFTGDDTTNLLVGSEDFDIRVFQNDEIIAEMSETEAVTSLHALYGSRFGYALANGTVGVYDRTARYWRIKSKNQAVTIFSYDINGDGVPELLTGWSNGKIDARSDRTGEVVFKDNLNSAIAGIMSADYRMTGGEELIVCSMDGEVRGYQPKGEDVKEPLQDITADQELLRELTQKKQALLLEIKNYEENEKISADNATNQDPMLGIIPANTQLKTSLLVISGDDHVQPHVELTIQTTNDVIIKAVIIFAEGIFDGESFVIHPPANSLTDVLKFPIFPPKDVSVDLHIKALVGRKTSTQFHVFELSRQLPRFSLFIPCPSGYAEPVSNVTFDISERVNRVLMWLNQNILVKEELVSDSNSINFSFLALRTGRPLVFKMSEKGQVILKTDDMELAGDIIQALANFLGIDDLASTAHFPDEIEKLRELINKADDLHLVREKLTAEMADHSNLIRNLLIRAEDARLMADMKNMRKGYMELFDLNRDLINGYRIRCNNHDELLSCLKIVNQTIQRAGKLRVGKSKSHVVASCRNAIKSNNVNALVKIIQVGSS